MDEDEASREFWPEHIRDNPQLVFVCNFIFLPLLLVWLVYAYIKTILFAYNTYHFYQRHKKNEVNAEFTTPGKHKIGRRFFRAKKKKQEKPQEEQKSS